MWKIHKMLVISWENKNWFTILFIILKKTYKYLIWKNISEKYLENIGINISTIKIFIFFPFKLYSDIVSKPLLLKKTGESCNNIIVFERLPSSIMNFMGEKQFCW